MSTSSKIYSTAWNFGPNESNEKSVEDLTKALSEKWPSSSWGLAEELEKNNEAKILSISSAKAASQLGWRPTWGFDETVAETVNWYRTYYESQTKVMREFSLETIKRYSES